MTDQEIFEQAISPNVRHDPRAELNQKIWERFKQLNDYYKGQDRFNQFKPYPRIIYDFMKSVEFDAFAMKHKEYYILCISECAYSILNSVFSHLLANKEILPSIGDITNESDVVNKFDYKNYATPNDPIRKKYATHLTIIAMDFLFEHELAHILNGHCDFVSSKYGMNRISESQQSTIYSDNLDFQTLEMDADGMAASRCVNSISNVIIGDNVVHVDFQIFFENIYDSIFHFSFGVSIMFHLFGEVDYKNMEVGKSNHPTPHLREYMLRGAVLKWFLQSKPFLSQKGLNVDQKRLTDSLLSGYIEAINGFNKVTGRIFNQEKYQHQYTTGHPLLQSVKNNWRDKIYQALTPLTFQKLVKPEA